MKVSRSMVLSSGLSQQILRRVCPLGLESSVQQNLHIALASFRPTVGVPLGEGATLLAYHGSPRSYDEGITAETPDAALAEMLAGHHAQVFAGGHTHVQMLWRHRDKLVMNPGSVGLPMDAVPPAEGIRNAPWAEYAVVTAEGGRLEVSLRRTPFDVAALLRAADESGMPHATWWKADWRRT